MKKFLSFLPLLFLFNCSSPESKTTSEPIPAKAIELFNLNDVPDIILEFELADWNKLLESYDQNPKNEKKVVTRFTFNINGNKVVLDSIGLKLRGNTSRRRPEGETGQLHNASNTDWHHCSFGIDFTKFKENQLFEGLSKLNLKWFKDDASYVREIYSYDLFKRYGCWTAPRASYCKVTIKVKGDNNPAYYGVYAMVESIDETYLASHQDKWIGADGFLWKGGWSDEGNANFVSTNSMGVEDVKLDAALSKYYAYDLKNREAELDAAKAELTQFITDLNKKTGADFQNWISQKMDVNLFLKTYAVNVVLGMWDDYWVNGNNFYFYFAPNGKAYFIPYDYDNTLGTSLLMGNSGTQNPLSWGKTKQRPLVTKILAIPQYQTLYKNYLKELVNPDNDFFAADKSMMRILNWQSKINNYIANDTGEDMIIEDKPASWGNQPDYRLLSGNSQGGTNGPANYFDTRAATIPW